MFFPSQTHGFCSSSHGQAKHGTASHQLEDTQQALQQLCHPGHVKGCEARCSGTRVEGLRDSESVTIMSGCFPCASVNELLKTVRAAWPMLSRAIRSGQVLSPQCQLEAAGPDVHCDYDVAVPMAEGYSLTANVFRSRARMRTSAPDPVVMCAHIYDNHITPALNRTPLGGPPQQYRLIPQGVPYPTFSEAGFLLRSLF